MYICLALLLEPCMVTYQHRIEAQAMTMIYGYEKPVFLSLVAWMLYILLENVIGTVVGPSLVFYIESVGGTNQDYGVATSAVCLGMTLLMTFFGKWVDSNGNKYQAPLACSYILGIIGALIYFLASILPNTWAVNAIVAGRFIAGMGAAGKSLVMSWITTAVPLEKQKTVVSFISVVAILGQTAGPVLNTLVSEIDTSIAITSNFSIPLNPLNSIGLLVAIGEALFWLLAVLYIEDPPPRKIDALASNDSTDTVAKSGLGDILKAMMHFDVAFPLVQNFIGCFSYSLYMVAIAPVAQDMLNWTPVEISKLAVVEAVVGAVASVLTVYLAVINTSDFTMLIIGFVVYTAAGVMTCLGWRVDNATVFAYAAPILALNFVGSFLGPASQSKFNKAVFSRPELAGSIGVLQSLYVQAYTLAGVVGPIFVGSYVLRDSNEVSLSSPHELTPWAWYMPILSLIIIIGLLYEEFVLLKDKPKDAGEDEDEEMSPDETTKLVADKRRKSARHSIVEVNQVFSRQYEVDRRFSCEVYINGVGIINPVETAQERKLMKELTKSKKEWEHLLTLDEEADEVEMEE